MKATLIHRYPVTIEGDTVQIGTANELAVTLDVLQGQHDRAVLEQLRPHLADILGGPSGLIATLKSLTPDDQVYLVDAVGSRLAALLQSARRLGDLFATLSNDKVESKILKTLGAVGLRALAQTPQDLAALLEWLYGRNDKLVLQLLGESHLRHLTRTGTGLAIVLDALETGEQKTFLNQLGWEHVLGTVRNGTDLAQLLRSMPAEIGTRFIAELNQQQIIEIIGNARDWEYLWQRLEPAEAKALSTKLKLTHHAA